MILVKFDNRKFEKEMHNMANYAIGFLEGVHRGKPEFLKEIGLRTKEILEQYIDSNARINPSILHHVYEWYRTGSPEARLFELQYVTGAASLSMNATFTQSRSVKEGSKIPFYDKATIMERGISVTVRPRNAQALRFEDNGETIFTKNPVTIDNPGGSNVVGGFDRIFSEFFEKYFTQSFMEVSGIGGKIRNIKMFTDNLSRGKSGGKQLGKQIGYKWITRKEGA